METTLKNYTDENGNSILCDHDNPNVKVIFKGSDNKLEIKGAHFLKAQIIFTGNNAVVSFGKSSPKKPHHISIRVGQDSSIKIADGLTIEKNASLFACEGASINIGKDCMLASNVQIRADDSHPIFDVITGDRLNRSKSIKIGDHCWLGFNSICLKGAIIGSGSVVAMNSIVTKEFPNNVLLVGSPAKPIRSNIAWERPNLATTLPHYKNHINDIKKTDAYWKVTDGFIDFATLYRSKEYKKIIDKTNKVVRLNEDQLYYRAMSFFKIKNYKQALQSFLKLRELNRNYKNIDLYVANSSFRNKAYFTAMKFFEILYINDPFNIHISKSLIICYLLVGDDIKAKALINDLRQSLSIETVDLIKKEVIDYLKQNTPMPSLSNLNS